MAAITVRLRPHREGIAALERDGFEVRPVRFSRGDHLIVDAEKEGVVVRATVSGSPSGNFIHSLVTCVRIKHRARQAR